MLMQTDPPYGVDYANDERPNPGVAKPRVAKPRVAKPRVANDDLMDGPKLQAFLEAAIKAALPHLDKHAAFYLWHPMLTQGTFFAAAAAAAAAADILIHRQIIWAKPVLLLGRGDYHWKHELCFYGWVRGNRPPFYGPRSQTTVWEIASVSQAERKEMNHATPKPVAIWLPPIENHTKPNEVMYEPFSGSGSQIIAAETTGRRCYAMELSPNYVDVAVRRWQQFTGKRATHADTGLPFGD
jgi:DNA modification methylase